MTFTQRLQSNNTKEVVQFGRRILKGLSNWTSFFADKKVFNVIKK